MGGEYTLLNLHEISLGEARQKMFKVLDCLHIHHQNIGWELRILKPLTLSDKAGIAIKAAAILPLAPWVAPIMIHFKERVGVVYEPLIEIMQAKSDELSALVNDLEKMVIAPS